MNLDLVKQRAERLSKTKDVRSSAKSMGLYYVGYGVTRYVYLDTKNLVVYKVLRNERFADDANLTEMAVWKALPEVVQNLFAKCHYISKNRVVLVAEFVDFPLTLFGEDHPANKRVERFIEKYNMSDFVADLGEENIAINMEGYCKVIDYAVLGCAKTLSSRKAIKSMAKYKAVRFANQFKRRSKIKVPVEWIKDLIPPFCLEE
jgi:hypothetical protein